ncbi:MAG: tRNA (adenosine(37)-N6)-threonylcarbamoyltransferase complex dimerization subunit type 1 TsaB [bacterium]
MKILAVETTGLIESVAVYDNGNITEINHEVKSHSAHLLKAIDKVLKKSCVKLEDLDYLAASTGPGSFIGTRIGLSTLQGLSLALNIPLVGAATLDALAENIWDSDLDLKKINYICPLILSKDENVYAAVYIIKNNKLKRVSKYQYVSINEFLKTFRKDKIPGCIAFLGETKGFENYIIGIFGEKAFILRDKYLPRAHNIALLAYRNIKKKKVKKTVYPSPIYVRPFLAKKMD